MNYFVNQMIPDTEIIMVCEGILNKVVLYKFVHIILVEKCYIEDTAFFLAPAEGFNLQPRLCLPFGQKKRAYYAVLAHFGNFWCPVVTLETFSSNLSNFKRNPKKKYMYL